MALVAILYSVLYLWITILSASKINGSNKVLVIGGSGRVGGSAVRSLLSQGYSVDVGGRNIDNWKKYKRRFKNGEMDTANFIPMDSLSKQSLDSVIPKYDLIINTAGPFQGLKENIALECCLLNGKSYIDVCDDIELSRICRSKYYQDLATKSGAVAIISAGIWPGGSSLLAQELIQSIQHKNALSSSTTAKGKVVDEITFSFFTAGSGGAGETILTATFLLLGENVLTYVNSQPVYEKPASNSQSIDFGSAVGTREVVRLNLIECESCFQSSHVPNVATYFGTAPTFWNTLFIAMARLTPQKILQDRKLMKNFAKISLPMVRLVDMFVGSKNGIRVDAFSSPLSSLNSADIITTTTANTQPPLQQSRYLLGTSLMVHEDLEAGVGHSIAAFALPFLSSSSSSNSNTAADNDHNESTTMASTNISNKQESLSSPITAGVYFPEEIPSETYRKEVLEEIKHTVIDCHTTLY